MFCSNCGQQAEEGRTYCAACGASLAPAAPRAPFPPSPTAPYGTPPAWGVPPAAMPTMPSNKLSTVAIVCGCIAVLFLPIILGPVAIIFAAIAMSKGEPRAKVALGVAIGGTVLGFALGFLVTTAVS